MYEITTARGFTGPRRRRAGVEVAQGGTVVVELTKEQLAEIEADPCLVVTPVKAAAKKSTAKKAAAKNLVDEQETTEA